MKKLNKILMPIVGLSTMATGVVIPTTSCSCSKYTDGVQVTNQEWKDALTNFATPKEGVSWKSSSEDVIQKLSIDSDGEVLQFNEFYNIAVKDNTLSCNSINANDNQSIAITNLISFKKDNFFFNYYTDATTKEKSIKNIAITPQTPIQSGLMTIFGAWSVFNTYKWNDENKTYDFFGIVQDTNPFVYVESQVRFNNSKKVTYINSHIVEVESDGKKVFADVILHPQYGNFNVDVSDEYIKDSKLRSKETDKKEGSYQFSDFISTTVPIKAAGVIVCTLPDEYGCFSLNCESGGWKVYFAGIYRNNILLTEGIEYTVVGNYIQFKEILKKGDKIDIAWYIDDCEVAPSTMEFVLWNN